jgi:hypothetical protein
MLTGHLPFDPSSLRAALDGDGRSLQPKPELLGMPHPMLNS